MTNTHTAWITSKGPRQNDAGTAVTSVELICSTNGGAFEKCGELALAEITLKEVSLWEENGPPTGLSEHLPKGAWTAKNDGEGHPSVEWAIGFRFECNNMKANGKDVFDTLGEFTMDFEECKNPSTGLKCNSLGDAAGVILMSGAYDYVYDTLTPTLGVAVLFLSNELHLECSALTLVLLRSAAPEDGGLSCLLLEPMSSKVTHLFHCEQEKGVQKERTYWNDEGTAITNVELLCSLNGAAFETCGFLMLFEWTFALANLWENV